MKRITRLLFSFLLVLILSGCGNHIKRIDNKNSVKEIINEQIDSTDISIGDSSQTRDVAPDAEPPDKDTGNVTKTPEKSTKQDTDHMDYDLTAMSSDMVYATIYQMMVEPSSYIGKTIRMEGLYHAEYYEPIGQYYHYCIIQDALGCCAQGFEFIWDDGNHNYPDEYPADNTEIIVQGTFETYQESGDISLYCRLKNSSLEIVENRQ